MPPVSFYCEESVYYRQKWNHTKEPASEEVSDVVEDGANYYWLEHNETGRIFQVPDFPKGLELLKIANSSDIPLQILEHHELTEEKESINKVFNTI